MAEFWSFSRDQGTTYIPRNLRVLAEVYTTTYIMNKDYLKCVNEEQDMK